jgi:tetratricopeptide (TPR) repeat protein
MRRLLGLGLLAAAIAAGLGGWWYYPRPWLRQGEAALAARDDRRARELLERYLSHRPNDARARLLAARAARRLREYYDAQEHLRLCREAGGDAELIEIETALIAVQRGEEPPPRLRQRAEKDDETARTVLEVLIQHDLDNYRLRPALQGLTRYLRTWSDDLPARLARAFVWERFLSFPDALEDYRQAVEQHPDSEPARLKLAETELIAGTPEAALAQYEWLAARHPERPEVRLGLARCRRRLGQLDEAQQQLAALAEEVPENGEVIWERGQVELDLGRAAEAEPWLRKAVRLLPHDRRVVYSLHRCLLALDRREEAEKVNARVAAIDADLRQLEKVRQAVMERPDDAALRCEGGLLFLRNGERDEGLRWLRLALRLDPQCQAARDALTAAEAAPAAPQAGEFGQSWEK